MDLRGSKSPKVEHRKRIAEDLLHTRMHLWAREGCSGMRDFGILS